ncbi:MAG: hypothetical protein LPK00_13705 [Bacillaceae bacterium]|nr:hypothetical protein [Bacillaceae bacterium]
MNKNVTSKKELERVEKQYSFFEKLIYLFIIPVLVVLTLTLGALTYYGINVFELANDLMPSNTETVTTVKDSNDESSNKDKKVQEDAINQNIVLLERQLQEKQNEILKLQEQLKDASMKINELESEREEIKKSIKELSNMYERMPTRKAAQIMVELEEELALKILTSLSSNKVSAILAQLDPTEAAKFTKLLSEE